MARTSQSFQLGLFGKGLLTGLVFGLIFSALVFWMLGSRSSLRDSAHAKVDCSAWAAQCAPSNAEPPRQFDFYSRRKEPAPTSPTPPNQATTTPPTSTTPSAPNTANTNPPVPANKNQYFLITRTYTKLAEAESIKAELALLGLEPKLNVIRGQFQLQLGPYSSATNAEKAKNELGNQASAFSVQ